MDILLKFITPGILFLLTVLFGFWLSRLGKPYHGALFNIHKLIALGAVILAVMRLSNLAKEMNLQVFVIALLVVAGLCVLALFASGAFMSAGKFDYTVTLGVHRIALVLVMITIGVVFRLLSVGK
jgi:hypothetical protein